MAKVHGSLARAGKVKRQTPKVAPKEAVKEVSGRAKKRVQYNARFLTQGGGEAVQHPNRQAPGKLA